MADVAAASAAAVQTINDQALATVALSNASAQADITTMQSRVEAGAANAVGATVDAVVQNFR